MKVAFLIEQFDPGRGGLERSAAEFLTEMARLGPELHVVTQAAGSRFEAAKVHALGRGGMGRSGRYEHFVQAAGDFLRSERWDVVHAVTPCLSCDLYQPRSGTAGESLARTVAVRRSGFGRWLRRVGAWFNPKQRLLMKLESELLRRPDPPMVAALSSYMRRQLAGVYGLNEDRLREVFNGVTVDLPSPAERTAVRQRLRGELGLGESDLTAIFVGHNFRRKGLKRLLEAMAMVEAKEWRLLVVGKDKAGGYIRYARRLGIGSRVSFLGSRGDVRQLYLAADAAVLPSYYDPCSRTVLEAMSVGLPCIATRYDGSSDCIQQGENGFVVDSPEAVQSMAEALNRLSDFGFRSRLAGNALSLRERLSMGRHAAEVLRLYEEISDGRVKC